MINFVQFSSWPWTYPIESMEIPEISRFQASTFSLNSFAEMLKNCVNPRIKSEVARMDFLFFKTRTVFRCGNYQRLFCALFCSFQINFLIVNFNDCSTLYLIQHPKFRCTFFFLSFSLFISCFSYQRFYIAHWIETCVGKVKGKCTIFFQLHRLFRRECNEKLYAKLQTHCSERKKNAFQSLDKTREKLFFDEPSKCYSAYKKWSLRLLRFRKMRKIRYNWLTIRSLHLLILQNYFFLAGINIKDIL